MPSDGATQKMRKAGLGESLLIDRDFEMRANTNHALCMELTNPTSGEVKYLSNFPVREILLVV